MDITKTEETPVNRLHFPARELNHNEEKEGDSTISSETGSNEEESSDCDQPSSIANDLGLVELLKNDKAYELIHRHCKSNLTPQFEIVSILKNGFQSPSARAKLKAFKIYADSVAEKNGGEGGGSKAAAEAARVKYGWCGVEKDELKTILTYGFSQQNLKNNNGGLLYLSPDNAPLQW